MMCQLCMSRAQEFASMQFNIFNNGGSRHYNNHKIAENSHSHTQRTENVNKVGHKWIQKINFFEKPIYTHLYWTKTHVNLDFVFSDDLERAHHMSDVIKVIDHMTKFLVHVLDEVECLVHLSLVLGITHFTVCLAPGFGLNF